MTRVPSCHPAKTYLAKGLCRQCYRKQNIKVLEYDKAYSKTEKRKATIKKYKQTSKYKAYAKEYNKKYRERPEHYPEQNARNKTPKYRENKRIARNKLYAENINYKLSELLRIRLRSALKRNFKTGSAVRDLGCTIDYLKLYLESLFKPGMTWANHGSNGWHIDHIMPLSKFNLTDREQLLKACHYTNLQPLWAFENMKKGNR